ncbi:serine protease inhibitor dipetalogastin-like isoform X1 [Dendronephthya gigantea]|uniref:serine protease inhibitor dipetalogastin-like isoform X1 n=1 Tax=Dendronephthya gigantea TaxID=151771 RepID=UPI00106A4816|nr:serine protease inhibitor dipetalogastin-like isoform X1 [Dendronephthya gigantea]
MKLQDLCSFVALMTVHLIIVSSSVHAKNREILEAEQDKTRCVFYCTKVTGLRVQQVRGSDGNTYPSACILKQTACQLGQEIKIAHRGSCRPKCQTACTKEYNPQCGTDGKTYGNPCQLKIALCESDGKVRLDHHGECNILEAEQDKTQCVFYCTRVTGLRVQQVRGSDGNTYPSACILKQTACQLGQEIKIAHKGSCRPKCQTACTKEYNPQCGTDGKTYGNPCQLKIALCESDGKVRLDHRGECKTKPKTCAVACPKIMLPPVCGSDGNTYPNFCILKETACQFDQEIKIVHIGACKPKCSAICTEEYNPQCGTDGKTYSNPCTFKRAQCESDGKIRLAHHGECK